MDTKLKSDIAESAVVTELLREGFKVRERYKESDFDFAILYIDELKIFYVMPADVFSTYKSGISLVENETRQRKPKSAEYRERWDLLSEWATQPATVERNLSNSVKPEMVIPSQVLSDPLQAVSRGEGVETRRQAPIAELLGVKV